MRDVLNRLQQAPSLSDKDQDTVAKINAAIRTFENGHDNDGNHLYCKTPPADLESKEFKDFFARFETAWDFYKKSGFKNDNIPGHLNGIDFRHEVKVVPLPPPNQMQQFQSAKSTYQGTYYAQIGTPPDALGIAPKGSQFDPKQKRLTDKTLIKVPNVYEVKQPPPSKNKDEDNRVMALTSTSAPIIDNWSLKAKTPIRAQGGGTQYFCAKSDAFKLVTDVKLTTSPPQPQATQQHKRGKP
jgi:hypothetical protein